MRFLTLITTVLVLFAFGQCSQTCRDEIARCHPIYCRFFARVRRLCKKTCGRCADEPTPTEPPFNSWSTCSRSCDSGTRFRVRRCPLNDFAKCPREFQDCNTLPCPRKTCMRNEEHRYNINSDCCTTVQASDNRCGAQLESDARIIGGAPAKQNQWPWMVRVEINIGQLTSLCGGSLITSEWVVTAAHCVNNYSPAQISAFVGYGSPSQAEMTVESFIIHPDYDLPLNDIALIKLASPVRIIDAYVQTICLPGGERSDDDKKCFIAGWGLTDSNIPVTSPILQEARIRILPYRLCIEAYKNRTFSNKLASDLQICAGSVDGRVDSCLGDSGGPIMCQTCSSCTWYMAGIVSIGPIACGSPNEPGVYTKIVTYEAWIQQHVGQIQEATFSC